MLTSPLTNQFLPFFVRWGYIGVCLVMAPNFVVLRHLCPALRVNTFASRSYYHPDERESIEIVYGPGLESSKTVREREKSSMCLT